MRHRKLVTAALAATMLIGSVASASAYTLPDADNGGFVGKGEVQTAFGWNNATMQANHQDVSFRYDSTVTYTFDCTWETGPEHNVKTHVNTKDLSSGVATAITNTKKMTGQFTGWYLDATDLGDGGVGGYPTDADCGAEGNEMKSIVPGSIETVGDLTGGLYAVHNGVERLLPVLP